MNDDILLKIGAGSINIYAMNENIILLECTKCKELKPLDEFHKASRRFDRHQRSSNCKACAKEHRIANKDIYRKKDKEYRELNKDKILQRERDRYWANKKEYNERSRRYYQANKPKISQKFKQYNEANKNKISQYMKDLYQRNKGKYNQQRSLRYKTDPVQKLKIQIRNNLARCVRSMGAIKTKPSIEYIGCTLTELKEHIQSQFQPGMSWDNYGRTGWHIDHIIPIDWWVNNDLYNALEKANHYTNLQPLWAKENLSKKNKLM